MNHYIAFEGDKRIAFGELAHVAGKTKEAMDRGELGPVLLLDAVTSRPIEVDFRGSLEEVLQRLPSQPAPSEALERRGKGRPKLGVVAREVTLLPRHWDWLNAQPGGASVALRRLVEEARKTNVPQDQKREAQESAYRFMTTVAGNLPGYEEALRTLFAADRQAFFRITNSWPTDVRDHARSLAERAMP